MRDREIELVNELSRQAAAADVRVLTAAADAIERSTAYLAWRPVVAAMFGIPLDEDASLAATACCNRWPRSRMLSGSRRS